MARKKPKAVPYRRKREQKTNYARRLRLLLSHKPRLVARFTSSHIIAQLAGFATAGDIILVGIDSFSLRKLGWSYSCKNIPAAYLTGLLFGKKALGKGHQEAVLDSGLKTPHRSGKIYAFLKGVVDSGMIVPHGDETIFPDKGRLSGKHVEKYAVHLQVNLKGKQNAGQRQFAQYLKNNAPPEKLSKSFDTVIQNIQKLPS